MARREGSVCCHILVAVMVPAESPWAVGRLPLSLVPGQLQPSSSAEMLSWVHLAQRQARDSNFVCVFPLRVTCSVSDEPVLLLLSGVCPATACCRKHFHTSQ